MLGVEDVNGAAIDASASDTDTHNDTHKDTHKDAPDKDKKMCIVKQCKKKM